MFFHTKSHETFFASPSAIAQFCYVQSHPPPLAWNPGSAPGKHRQSHIISKHRQSHIISKYRQSHSISKNRQSHIISKHRQSHRISKYRQSHRISK